MPRSCLVVQIKSGIRPLIFFFTAGGKEDLLEEGSGHPKELNKSGFMSNKHVREQSCNCVKSAGSELNTEKHGCLNG